MLEPGFLRSRLHPRSSPGIKQRKGEDLDDATNEGRTRWRVKTVFVMKIGRRDGGSGISWGNSSLFPDSRPGTDPTLILSIRISQSWQLALLSVSVH